ncbi:MAG: glycoside hydrolase family 127 protein [Oscillospiraceae bacterium]|jgi:DUF1680 family protein|nr:glycoside hydrolase family 127 protein [Oscillospiraceae bacterium]
MIGIRYTPAEVGDVRYGGGFLADALAGVRTRMIPYQWEALNDRVPDGEPSHCIKNFRIAAREAEGDFAGFVFQDSDLAKWLEAVAYQLAQRPDAALQAQADAAIDLIAKAQQPDGYLNTHFIIKGLDKRWTNLRDCHELYCAGHMLEAAVAYARATGQRKLLDVMVRFVAHIASVFGEGEGQLRGYPGHEEIELALVKLYDFTGDPAHLALARFFIDVRGESPHYFIEEQKKLGKEFFLNGRFGAPYSQSHQPVREQTTLEGHAVRALYLLSGMADVALRTGDEALWATTQTLYRNATARRMYLTGGVGSTGDGEAFTFDYDLPNDTVYAETCASIALIFVCQRLLRAELKGDYADTMERALYNTCLAAMSLDQEHFFYVNPLSVSPEASKNDRHKSHVLPVRPRWFGCACCPPNLARLLSSLGAYQYSAGAGEIAVHLYIGGEATLQTEQGAVTLTMTTNYPDEGRIALTAGKGDYTLRLHLPGWVKDYTITVNGKPVQPAVVDGYLVLPGPFDQTEILLDLAMPPRRVYASPLVADAVGRVALMRGPLVYCLESVDNGENLPALSLPKGAAVRVEQSDLLGGTTLLCAEGERLTATSDALYTDAPNPVEPAALTFIPYYKWANRGENEMQVWVREG